MHGFYQSHLNEVALVSLDVRFAASVVDGEPCELAPVWCC